MYCCKLRPALHFINEIKFTYLSRRNWANFGSDLNPFKPRNSLHLSKESPMFICVSARARLDSLLVFCQSSVRILFLFFVSLSAMTKVLAQLALASVATKQLCRLFPYISMVLNVVSSGLTAVNRFVSGPTRPMPFRGIELDYLEIAYLHTDGLICCCR